MVLVGLDEGGQIVVLVSVLEVLLGAVLEVLLDVELDAAVELVVDASSQASLVGADCGSHTGSVVLAPRSLFKVEPGNSVGT